MPGLTEPGYVFTTLEDRANRIHVTVTPDYYDRSPVEVGGACPYPDMRRAGGNGQGLFGWRDEQALSGRRGSQSWVECHNPTRPHPSDRRVPG